MREAEVKELGALLTDFLGVTAEPGGGPTDFTNLGLLVTVCNLSSLLPLLGAALLAARIKEGSRAGLLGSLSPAKALAKGKATFRGLPFASLTAADLEAGKEPAAEEPAGEKKVSTLFGAVTFKS